MTKDSKHVDTDVFGRKLPTRHVQINPEYQALLPPLPQAEFGALRKSIEENGLHLPIIVNPRGYILDGHNRFMICSELGFEPRYGVKNLGDPLSEKRFVIESNLQRRHLTPFARIKMALPLLEVERKLARQRMLRGDPSPNLDEGGRAIKLVAERIGVSATLPKNLGRVRRST